MATDSRIETSFSLPETTGKYEVVTNLGQGTMAEVLLAVRRGPYASNKLVVIKKLKAAPDGDQELVNMFVDEARIAMRLSHPNVVSTFDFVAQGHEFYLTMEFLDGPSLLQVTRTVGRQKVPLELHVWILTQVLAGLAYAHQLRDFDGTALEIVHRDVTPSNVILTHGGGVKLVDFGIAKVAGAVAVTQSGMMKGKIGYASPEQCLGRPTTMSSDLYSVGVMLWEAMARKGRSVGETPAAVFQARIAGMERPIEDVWPDAPPRLARSVRCALASAPEDRHGSAQEFQRDLEEYLGGVSPATYGPRALTEFLTVHFGHARAALQRTIETRLAAESRTVPLRVATPTEVTGSSHGLSRTTFRPRVRGRSVCSRGIRERPARQAERLVSGPQGAPHLRRSRRHGPGDVRGNPWWRAAPGRRCHLPGWTVGAAERADVRPEHHAPVTIVEPLAGASTRRGSPRPPGARVPAPRKRRRRACRPAGPRETSRAAGTGHARLGASVRLPVRRPAAQRWGESHTFGHGRWV